MPGQPDTAKDGLSRVYDAEPEATTFLFTRGDEKRPVKDQPLAPGVPRVLERQATLGPIAPVSLPPDRLLPRLRSASSGARRWRRPARRLKAREDDAGEGRERACPTAKDASRGQQGRGTTEHWPARRLEAARSRLVSLEAGSRPTRHGIAQPPRADAASLARAAAKAERRGRTLHDAEEALLRAELAPRRRRTGRPGHRQAQGRRRPRKAVADARTKRDAGSGRPARRSARRCAKDRPTYSPLEPASTPPTSTGRRLALARWIADRKNPLTARVAVNHIWLRHFGTPLVPTSSTSASTASRRRTPRCSTGWRSSSWTGLEHEAAAPADRHQQRLPDAVVRAAGPADPNLAIDPDNRYFWRMNPRRMEAEVVRDNLLHVAGRLDPTLGGPGPRPETGPDLAAPQPLLPPRQGEASHVPAAVRRGQRRCRAIAGARASCPSRRWRWPTARSASPRRAGWPARARTAGRPRRGPPTDAAFVAAAFERSPRPRPPTRPRKPSACDVPGRRRPGASAGPIDGSTPVPARARPSSPAIGRRPRRSAAREDSGPRAA